MKDSRSVEISVGLMYSRLEGPCPVRELIDLFAIEERGPGGHPFLPFRPDRSFYTGLVPEVREFLSEQGIGVRVKDERERPLPAGSWALRGVTPRPYQERVAQLLGQDPLLLAQLPSAAGKTLVGLTAIARMAPRRVIYLTDRLDLAIQFREAAREFLEVEAGMVDGGKYDAHAPLVVASVDSALPRWEALGSFEMTVADEAHAAAAPRYAALVERLASHFRVGLSATPYRKQAGETVLLRSFFGRPVELETMDTLDSDGYVVRPRLRVVPVAGPSLPLTLVWQQLEDALTSSPLRNGLIVREALGLAETGGAVLILVHLIRHGERLQEIFAERDRRVPFLTGSPPPRSARESSLNCAGGSA